MISILTIIIIVFVLLIIICSVSWYRIVPSSQAHLVIKGTGKRGVYSSDEKFRSEGAGSSYFAIPEFIPVFGRIIRTLDVTIKELLFEQETIEKDQARYVVTSSTKYRVTDVQKAAESFVSDTDLKEQLKEIIQAAVRETTVKHVIENARSKRQDIAKEIKQSIAPDLENWGVELVNFVLVDFKDAPGTSVISDISKRREVEINSTTREQNAERIKQAKIKEAEADEKAKEREIARDKVVSERKQEAQQAVAEKEKLAQEKVYEVKQVQIVRDADIVKEAAIVKANQDKETFIIDANRDKEIEKIRKEQKQLEGEGDKLRAEEQAKAEAAPIKEKGTAEANIIKLKGLAEAEAKEKLQQALNKFGDKAIQALVAEKIVDKDREVGVAAAKALEKADMRIFAGSDNGNGFDLGKIISQTSVSNNGTADALLNKFARPNDLGFSESKIKAEKTPKNIKN